MSLSERVLESTADVRDQVAAFAARAADLARSGADRAAEQVAAARAPLEVLTEASLKLNALSHQCLSKLLARQGTMLKDALAEGEQRLQRLARAGSLQEAVAGQVADAHEIPARIADNVRENWAIVAQTGREVAQLASSTYAGLMPAQSASGGTARPARKGRAKATRKGTRRRRAA